jgi:predicted MFS family arabinose efflux permease
MPEIARVVCVFAVSFAVLVTAKDIAAYIQPEIAGKILGCVFAAITLALFFGVVKESKV